MKLNKKATLSAAAVLGIGAIVAVIGTNAFFTDTKSTTNTFTVGDIDIKLYESQLHRMNSGRQGTFSALASDPHYCDYHVATQTGTDLDGNTSLIMGSYGNAKYCTPGMNAGEGDSSTISAIENGHVGGIRTWGYKDETIITDSGEDSANYKSGYLADVSSALVPGQYVRKFAYAKNTGNNDAYVMIRYMVPTEYADKLEIKVPHTPYSNADSEGGKAYFTAVTKGDSGYVAKAYDADPYEETIDNVTYKVYSAVTTEPIEPGEMTYWSPVNTIKIKDALTETDIAPETVINVKVDAQAIQATTFDDAITAINNL